MTEDERDEVVAKLLEGRVGHATDWSSPGLAEVDSADIDSLMAVADLLWEAANGAPPLADDPVAAMLGLVPDPQCALDPRALVRARKSARLKVSELAERLVARGWDVDAGDVFRWQTRPTTDVAPALMQAIADETGTTMDRLTANRGSTALQEAVAAATRTPAFEQLVHRWAQLRGQSKELAASALQSRMLATVHRGDHPDSEQWLQTLEALVSSVEAESENRREH